MNHLKKAKMFAVPFFCEQELKQYFKAYIWILIK